MPVETEIPTHLNMRIEPKLRYLADLAARATGTSLTEYIEEALWQSFAKVSLDQFPELNEEPNSLLKLSAVERQAHFRKRGELITNPLSTVGERLWSEHPFARIQLLIVGGFEHLMSDDERTIWDHAFAHYAKSGKLSTKLVVEHWNEIKTAALSKSRKARKAATE